MQRKRPINKVIALMGIGDFQFLANVNMLSPVCPSACNVRAPYSAG